MKVWTNQNLLPFLRQNDDDWGGYFGSFGCVTLTCMEKKPRAMMRWRAGTAACGQNHFSIFLTTQSHQNKHCASRHHGNGSKEKWVSPTYPGIKNAQYSITHFISCIQYTQKLFRPLHSITPYFVMALCLKRNSHQAIISMMLPCHALL